jgi:anti-sigma regulatory factor (Ser/Thr protein kinase)
MNLALDEVVTNVIRYAHDDDGRQHPIVVRLALEQDVLTAQVEDDGRAFNPLEAPAPTLARASTSGRSADSASTWCDR